MDLYTFHKSVRGYSHVLKDTVCEDYSGHYISEDGLYRVIAVADGHGSSECFRSSVGSKLAVETAMDCLKRYIEVVKTQDEKIYAQDIFSDDRKCDIYEEMKIVTDSIVEIWNELVMKDIEENPISDDELTDFTKEHITSVYGTTLMAALWMPGCLILLQQGDGRCEVIGEDGVASQPIPWDVKCMFNVTTSMCEADAADRIRSKVIDFSKEKVIACYLGTDGIEDTYRDTYEALEDETHELMGGVHCFYKQLSCDITKYDTVYFEDFIGDYLSEFSKSGPFNSVGSGDDISVAGIVDKESIKAFLRNYEADVEVYNLEERLSQLNNQLKGKQRKHGILERRKIEAEDKLKGELDNDARGQFEIAIEKYKEYHEKYVLIEAEIQKIQDQIMMIRGEQHDKRI